MKDQKTTNLMEGLLNEMNRVRELIAEYDKVPMGVFGASMMRQTIAATENAIGTSDTIQMLKCYQELQGHTG